VLRPPVGTGLQNHGTVLWAPLRAQADTGVGGALSDSIVSNVHISHTKCGMWLDGPFDSFLITGMHIHDTTADGVNFHRGITNSIVEQSTLRNTGDDCLAMWSDQQVRADAWGKGGGAARWYFVSRPVPCHPSPTVQADVNNTFRYNTVQVPVLANNVAIYGGSGNAAIGNWAADTLTEGGGLHVGNRFSAVPLSGVTVLSGNEMHRTGQLDSNWNFGVAAVWFYALDSAMTGTILVNNTRILDSPYEAFQFIGSSVVGVAISNVSVMNVGTFVFQLQCAGAATVSDLVATGSQYYGIYDCGVQFTLANGGGNVGWNTTTCGFPPAL